MGATVRMPITIVAGRDGRHGKVDMPRSYHAMRALLTGRIRMARAVGPIAQRTPEQAKHCASDMRHPRTLADQRDASASKHVACFEDVPIPLFAALGGAPPAPANAESYRSRDLCTTVAIASATRRSRLTVRLEVAALCEIADDCWGAEALLRPHGAADIS